jgi:serine phosphatase RsbU (regulator of sigma subunit)
MIGGTAVFILYLNGLFPQNYFTLYSQQTGTVLEVVLLSLGLANRINVMKESLADLNENLENKVEDRTEELEAAMHELQAVNEELVTTRDMLWSEIELAKKIQTILLPQNPAIRGYEICTYMDPAESVGGDYYDIINFDSVDWLLIGDVSGHGVSAGLIMMMVQSSIHTFLRNFPEMKPSHLLEHVNETIKDLLVRMNENKFMTISAFSFKYDTDILYSGRHEYIFIYRSGSQTVESIKPDGIMISALPLKKKDVNIGIKLEPGDIMLLYTDGIIEAVDSQDELFSHEKLMGILADNGEKSVEVLKDAILTELKNYTVDDDVTIVALKKL